MVILPVVSLLMVIAINLLITRIATAALVFTGVSRELAEFQARSALTTCGFTSMESESIVEHPVRRRIVMILMLVGNAGLIGAITSMAAIFVNSGSGFMSPLEAIAMVFLGIAILYMFSRSAWLDQWLFKLTHWAMQRFRQLDLSDYSGLLHISEGYKVRELEVEREHWVTGRNLKDLRLSNEGIQVLGIHRASDEYIGSPTGETYVRTGDRLILYGRIELLGDIQHRRAGNDGDQAHRVRCAEQEQLLKRQEENDRTRRERNGVFEKHLPVH